MDYINKQNEWTGGGRTGAAASGEDTDREAKRNKALFAKIEKDLSAKRWKHTLGVVKEAKRLALQYGADEQKAEFAAYCHDLAKEFSKKKNKTYMEKHRLPADNAEYPELAHGYVAAAILQNEHNVKDEDILNAIRYHSTGRENMSLLEKIIYIADLIEEGRQYEGIEAIRQLARTDLDEGMKLALAEVMDFVRQQGKEPDELSLKALRWLQRSEKGGQMDNKQIAEAIGKVLDDKKGMDIVTLDLSVKSSFCDYFIIVTGSSDRQVKTLSEEVEDKMAQMGVPCKNIEGKNTGWILLDYGDIIVSVFTAEQREKYNLERIWTEVEHDRNQAL